MKKSLAIIVIAASASALMGCKHKSDNPTPAPPVKVSVTVVDNAELSDSQQFSGTVAAANTASVSFSVAGTIDNVFVAEGQRVAQGTRLASLKNGDYVNAKAIADAQLAEAQDAYERLKKLHDANALPDIKWVEIQQKLRQAQGAADIAARALSETVLLAPMSGVVSKKFAQPGQNVIPVEPVFEIVGTESLDIEIPVPENQINGVELGQKATVVFDSKEPFTASVTQKAVVADPLTRTYKVKIAIPAGHKDILPGMVGTVAMTSSSKTEQSQPAIVLPSQAVGLTDDNRTFVWVVKDSKAQRRFVSADELAAAGVVIRSGLEPGDSVIVAGMQKVGTGSEVVIAE